MAKQSVLPTSGGGIMPKVVGALITIAVIAFVVQQPAEAANLTKNIFGLFAGAVDGLATFINQTAG